MSSPLSASFNLLVPTSTTLVSTTAAAAASSNMNSSRNSMQSSFNNNNSYNQYHNNYHNYHNHHQFSHINSHSSTSTSYNSSSASITIPFGDSSSSINKNSTKLTNSTSSSSSSFPFNQNHYSHNGNGNQIQSELNSATIVSVSNSGNYIYSSLSPPLIDFNNSNDTGSSTNTNSVDVNNSSSSSAHAVAVHSSSIVASNNNKSFYFNNRANEFNSPNSTQHNLDKIFQHVSLKNRVSAFLPTEEVNKNDQIQFNNENVRQIYADLYSNDGKIDDLIRVMSFHPNFLKEFIKFNNFLLYSQGALTYESRHFLAIMAAARHKCYYLVNQQENEFQAQKGQKNWLLGIDHIPHKLKEISELNKLLCHQPWLINEHHIEKLLKNKYSWSITELIMATTILAHFHALSGFVFGLGINENYMQELMLKQQTEEIEKRKQLAQAAAAQAAAVAKLNEKKHFRNKMNKKKHHDQENVNYMSYEDMESASGSDNEDYLNENDSSSSSSDDEQHIDDDTYELNEFGGVTGGGRMRNFHFRSRNNYRSNDAHERARSDSTGTANRTLSNSSASSCEIGIDMLLKEMQMIQADDKNYRNTGSISSGCENKLIVASSSSIGSAPLTSSSPATTAAVVTAVIPTTTSTSQSSSSSSSSFIPNRTLATNTQLTNLSSSYTNSSSSSYLNSNQITTSQTIQTVNSKKTNTSGTNTITNSPISSSVSNGYLTDLSNCASTNSKPINHYKSYQNHHYPVVTASNTINNNNNNSNNHTTISTTNSNGHQTSHHNNTNNNQYHHDNDENEDNISNHCDDEESDLEIDDSNNHDNQINDEYCDSTKQQQYKTNEDNNNNQFDSTCHLVLEQNDSNNNNLRASSCNRNSKHSKKSFNNNNNNNQYLLQSSQQSQQHSQQKLFNQKPVLPSTNNNNNNNNNSNNKPLMDQQQQQYSPCSLSSFTAQINKKMLKYANDPDSVRLNFKNADQTLKLEYYTWENQGYTTACSFYSDICELLDEKFRLAGNMTYHTMGSHKQVDTSLFRRAVWLYIHSIFGIRYDDYDYTQIKTLIASPLRNYIKILCACPDRITKKDYDRIMKEFTHSEKVHINIVIMEARIQASLLYFLRAINSYFSSNSI